MRRRAIRGVTAAQPWRRGGRARAQLQSSARKRGSDARGGGAHAPVTYAPKPMSTDVVCKDMFTTKIWLRAVSSFMAMSCSAFSMRSSRLLMSISWLMQSTR